MAGRITNRMSELRQTVRSSSTANVNRRQKEDNLAVIFMAIVIVFLVCHFPRILLSLQEMLIIKNTMACANQGHYPFPLWVLVLTYFSHILLVLNCSMNSVIYCIVSSKYRAQALKYLQSIRDTFKRCCSNCSCGISLCKTWRWHPETETDANINVSHSYIQ